tara:strand:+ start:42 stop:500 length:459 start_codon:yes stop_codon:yes gene_type:complete
MALPVTAGVRLAMAIAKHAGKKLIKKGTGGYKLSKSLVKSKRRRTLFAKATVRKTGTALDYASKQASIIGKQTKRHLKFYKKVISPEGTQFKNLITRPTFGQRKLFSPGAIPGSKFAGTYVTKTTKGMKTRSKLLKGGLYGGYIYGASKLKS